MAKDLSPKSNLFVPAEQEVMIPTLDLPMGQRIGGVSMFGDSFKRGSGDSIFGASNEGIWLGAADFADAPFRVNMDGALVASSATFKTAGGTTFIDSLGVVSSSTFTSSDTANGSLNQSFTTTSNVNVTGSDMQFTLSRTALVAFFVHTRAYLIESVGNKGDGHICMQVGPTVYDFIDIRLNSGCNFMETRMTYNIIALAAGTWDIKLVGKLVNIYSGSPSMTLFSFNWSYLILGT